MWNSVHRWVTITWVSHWSDESLSLKLTHVLLHVCFLGFLSVSYTQWFLNFFYWTTKTMYKTHNQSRTTLLKLCKINRGHFQYISNFNFLKFINITNKINKIITRTQHSNQQICAQNVEQLIRWNSKVHNKNLERWSIKYLDHYFQLWPS